MEQNKNTCFIKRVLYISFTIVIMFSFISLPAFATLVAGEYDTIEVTGSLSQSETSWLSATPLAGDQGETGYRALRVGADQTATTAYLYQSGNTRKVRFISAIENTKCYIMARQYTNSTASYYLQTSQGLTKVYICSNPISYNEELYYYVDSTWDYIPLYSSDGGYQLPYYDNETSLNDANAEACAYLSGSLNPPTPEPITGEFTSSLQAGYAMAIDITNLNVSLTLTQTTPVSYWGLGATQFIGTVSEIPNPITENSASSIIRWTGTGKTDMYGKYYNWVSNNTISGNASNHQHVYVLIVNPLNNTSTTGSGYDVQTTSNGIITVHVSNSNHVKIYPMSTTFNAGNFNSQTEGISATGSPDGNGGLTYTDDNTGQTYNQEHGGLTTPTNTQNTINAWLENIANTIGGFFSGAVGAVTTLVNAGSAFINQLISLYSWLPAPVYTVLSSALILVITIGVIKVFV